MEEMIILALFLVVGLILQIKYKEVIYHSWKERILATSIIFVVMMSWEFFAKMRGVWIFPGPGTVGVFLFGLPLELYLLYLVAPYFAFTFYETLHIWFDKRKNQPK